VHQTCPAVNGRNGGAVNTQFSFETGGDFFPPVAVAVKYPQDITFENAAELSAAEVKNLIADFFPEKFLTSLMTVLYLESIPSILAKRFTKLFISSIVPA
jgi:hypothetical protein